MSVGYQYIESGENKVALKRQILLIALNHVLCAVLLMSDRHPCTGSSEKVIRTLVEEI